MKKDIRIRIADPSGNITIFVLDHFERSEYAAVARQLFAMEELRGEQVAFITGPDSMDMCGLEFCGNASRAFALMRTEADEFRDIGDSYVVPVRISGADDPIDVKVTPAECHAEIAMPLHSRCDRWADPAGTLVDFGGIVHFVIEDAAADEEVFIKVRDRIAAELDPPAIGVMFCKDDRLEPIVYVKDVDTVYHEGSCCSGTTAVAVSRSTGKPDGRCHYTMTQPAGVLSATAEVTGGQVTGVWVDGKIVLHDPVIVTIDMPD